MTLCGMDCDEEDLEELRQAMEEEDTIGPQTETRATDREIGPAAPANTDTALIDLEDSTDALREALLQEKQRTGADQAGDGAAGPRR